MRDRHQTTIAILGGNTVVGHALALLLKGVGYETQTLEAPPTGLVDDLLAGVDLLLVSPGLSDERRVVSLAILGGVEEWIRIPVIELTSAVEEGRFTGEAGRVPWPTSIYGLVQEIEAALRAADAGAEAHFGNLAGPASGTAPAP